VLRVQLADPLLAVRAELRLGGFFLRRIITIVSDNWRRRRQDASGGCVRFAASANRSGSRRRYAPPWSL
jgi:hypothetical protein